MRFTNPLFWKNKKVFLTGHTGFKGSWLALWLSSMGAEVCGYALAPKEDKSLFLLADVASNIRSIDADIRDLNRLTAEIKNFNPELVIHMAAQPLVRYSYEAPVETYEVNVLGTVNILEASLKASNLKAVLNITSDKCYENIETFWGYRENDPMGGFDPYSSSKGCAELVTKAYRQSFYKDRDIGLATARAGNVIGGGDFSKDRLIPDLMEAFLTKKPINLRYPQATRPWQHVLESLSGYLLLMENLYNNSQDFSQAWNFGPASTDVKSVISVVRKVLSLLEKTEILDHPLLEYTKNEVLLHEAHSLALDCTKVRLKLGWEPKWNLDTAIAILFLGMKNIGLVLLCKGFV